MIDWKSIVVEVEVPKDSPLGKHFSNEVKKAEECIVHKLNATLFSKPYRKYRRGKNRCERCGLKK